MSNRKQKVEEIMDSFYSLKRSIFFRSVHSKECSITPSQLGVLMVLEELHKGTVKDIAQLLHMSSSAATQLVDGLVKSGYVIRKEDSEDRRKVVLTLSRKAHTQAARMKKDNIERFCMFFEPLNDSEFDQYIKLHKKIVERLLKKGDEKN